MALYEVSWHGPEIIYRLTGIWKWVLDVVVVETLLILLENLFDFLFELGDPVSKWMFSVPDFLQ